MIEAQGSDGRVSFDGTLVTIRRGGGALRSWRTGTSSKSIPAWAIAGVELVPAGLGRGSIGFLTWPADDAEDAEDEVELLDEHTVAFGRSQQAVFEEVQRQVKAAAFAASPEGEARLAPRHPAASGQGAAAMADLRRMGELLRAGVISRAEFEQAKARLLDRI